MSITFTVEIADDSFDILITRKGDVYFLNYNIEYDIAMKEFGEKRTEAVRIYENLKNHTVFYIFFYNVFPSHIIRNFIMDCVMHILPIYTESQLAAQDAVRNKKILDYLNEAKGFPVDRLGMHAFQGIINNLIEALSIVVRSTRSEEYAGQLAAFEYLIGSFVQYVGFDNAPERSQEYQKQLYFYHMSNKKLAESYYEKEKSWQILRIVDVLEEIFRDGGKWPPLGATK